MTSVFHQENGFEEGMKTGANLEFECKMSKSSRIKIFEKL